MGHCVSEPRNSVRRLFLCGLCAGWSVTLLLGCTSNGPSASGSKLEPGAMAESAGAPAPQPGLPEAQQPELRAEVINLATALGVPDPDPVGVAVDPDTGDRYVLDAANGLFRLVDGGAQRVARLDELVDPSAPLASALTDLAACGEGRLLLTARNDGFLFDLQTRLMQRHFCYVPSVVTNVDADASQLTASVACDATRIFAQPFTYDGGGNFTKSEIGVWNLETGVDENWYFLADQSFLAGGMAVWDANHLVLGRGSSLQFFDLNSHMLSATVSVAEYGVRNADGLAYDRARSEILITDASHDSLVVIPVGLLELPAM